MEKINIIKVKGYGIYNPIVGISTTYKICFNKMNIFKILGFEKFKCKLNLIVEYAITLKWNGWEMPKKNYNQVLGKLNLNIGILKLKESRFKKLGKLQVNVFNFALERTSDDIGYNGKAFFNKYIFDVLVLKYNILKGLSLSLHLLNFEMRCWLDKVEQKEDAPKVPVFGSYWMPSLEIKFDVAKYLVAKKKK